LYGAEKSDRPAENKADLESFTSSFSLLSCDAGTAEHYGYLANVLRKRGRPLPQNDLWIAAVARQYGLMVATRDKHFQQVPDLSVLSW
jgi:tRNA(fMet)-specific endonuclease VapC